MSTDKTAVFSDYMINSRTREIDYLVEKGFRVKKDVMLTRDGMNWLHFIKLDLIVFNPIMADMQKCIDFVDYLREPNSANKDTPIIAYSVLSDPNIIFQLQQYNVNVVNETEINLFRKTIDSLF